MNLIRERSMKPNLITFGVLALACKDFAEAKELIDSIERIGYRVNVEILGALALRASQKLDVKMLKFILLKLRHERLKPNKRLLQHIDQFRKRVEKHQRKMKNSTSGGFSALDSESFLHEYEKLCVIFEKLKQSELEDDDSIHPWEQFRSPRLTSETSVN